MISEKYGIGRSTVGDIKKNEEKILKLTRDAAETGNLKKVKAMKPAKDENLEEALYIWFKQKRMEGVPISGAILKKALQLNEKLGGKESFVASKGWRWRFCCRFGIYQLAIQGEKLSSDDARAEDFVNPLGPLLKRRDSHWTR